MTPMGMAGIGIAVLLLFLLWLGGRNRAGAPGAAEDPLPDLVRLPPPGLLGRCLSVEDAEFAAGLGSRGVLGLLLRERRRLALEWLRQTRREAGRLLRLHVRRARYAPDLRPAAEVKLLLQFAAFLALYQVLVGIVRLYGPFRARTFVNSVRELAGVLAHLGGRIAETVNPSAVPGFGIAGAGSNQV